MKIYLLYFTLLFSCYTAFAQAPQSFKYQAVIRNSNNSIVENQLVSLRISILSDSALGNAVYVETHSVATNDFGLVNINIGKGTVVQGVFESINWKQGSYFIKTELDINGTSNYNFIGTTPILSVPYALYAETTANSLSDHDTSKTNEIQILSRSNDTLYLSNGGEIYLGDYKDNTDSQTIQLSGNNVLTISNGNSIQLSAGLADNDADPTNELQNLTINNGTISITSGNSIQLPDSSTTNELQTLTLSNDTISISNGNSIVLSPDVDADTTNEIQNLSIINDTLSISKGNKVALDVYLDNTDTQNIKFSNDTLSITNGNSVYIPPPFNFSFPDGTDNITPITMDSLLLVPYTVPAGYNLYITKFYIGAAYNGSLTIDGIVVFSSGNKQSYSRSLIIPLIAGSGSMVKAADNNSSINGFLIKAKVTPITLKNLYTTSYVVPQGYTFYITNIYSSYGADGIKIDNTIVNYGTSNYDTSSNTFFYIDFGLPIFAKGGQTINGISITNTVTINGYLK